MRGLARFVGLRNETRFRENYYRKFQRECMVACFRKASPIPSIPVIQRLGAAEVREEIAHLLVA